MTSSTVQPLSAIARPRLGQGTWRMGESQSQRQTEIEALRLGLDCGLTLIDTAEMYGEGGAEEVVGEAIQGRRQEVFLVSKVYPHNATRLGTGAACQRSLRRLKTDYLDLYLLHWRGEVPLDETLEALQSLRQAGSIRAYGVSNFDVNDLEEALSQTGGRDIAANQVLYNLKHRGIEWDLLPWSHCHGLTVMAYSPMDHAPAAPNGLQHHPALKSIAGRHHAAPAQIAIAWMLRQQVVVIAKASAAEHVRQNRAAVDLLLSDEDVRELDEAFPPPDRKVPLAMR